MTTNPADPNPHHVEGALSSISDTDSLVDRLARLPEPERLAILDTLPDDLVTLITSDWRFIARPDQLPPQTSHPWMTWVVAGGRGAGKSRTGAEFIHDRIIDHYESEEHSRRTRHRISLGARTGPDGRDVMVEGEALALDTLVPTPTGYRTMGDLEIGDIIFGGNGKPCTVIEAFPILHDRDCYRLTFKGGGTIVADADHRWFTTTSRGRQAYQRQESIIRHESSVKTTREIAETVSSHNGLNHSVPAVEALYDGDTDLPVDPYLLGIWLGDGATRDSRITSADPEVWSHIADLGYQFGRTEPRGRAETRWVKGMMAELRELGVLDNKHVPDIYLYGPRPARLAVLQGLLDSDGTISERGQIEFSNTNTRLVDAVVHLVSSLGINSCSVVSRTPDRGRVGYRVRFCTSLDVFRLPRKLERLPESIRGGGYRLISACQPVPSVPVRCIAVDSPDHTFLVTRHHIPTHNSGLLAVADRRNVEALWQPSKRRITWPDLNAWATLFSAEEPDQARGPQSHTVWCDEFASFDFSITDDLGNTLWTNLLMGLRLGDDPRSLITTTPKRVSALRQLVEEGLDPDNHTVVITRASTLANAANLSPVFLDKVVSQYEGTRLYRQEVLGILLDDDDDIMFPDEAIVLARRFLHNPTALPRPVRTVIGVDPATSLNRDETGIIAVSLLDAPLPGLRSRCVSVRADRSLKGSPQRWAKQVVSLYRELSADAVVVERNQGGEMARAVLENEDVDGILNIETVWSVPSKRDRATPVSQLYEQQRVAHVVDLPILEKQQVDWIPEDSDPADDDRVDALVHAINHFHDRLYTRPAAILAPSDRAVIRGRRALEDAVAAANGNPVTLTNPPSIYSRSIRTPQ